MWHHLPTPARTMYMALVCLAGCSGCRVDPHTGGGAGAGTGVHDDTGEGDEGTGGDDTSTGSGGDDTSTGTGGDDTGTGTGTDDTGDPPERSPNILLLIADDFGLDMAGLDAENPCYEYGDLSNQPVMPNLAALCAEGVRFETAWAQPSCSPVRSSMLTGMSPWQHGVGAPVNPEVEDDYLDTSSFTLPRAMALGAPEYELGAFGKWHVSQGEDDPNLAGWPHYAGHLIGTLDSYTAWDRNENGVVETCEDYATTRNVDDALAWLGEVEVGSPWLMWVAFNAPHDPFHLPPADLHDRTELTEYADEEDARPWVIAMSEALDTELGRLLDQVRTRGEWDDTVVIFLGDNGTDRRAVASPVVSSKAKGTLYRGGVQVPMFVSGGRVLGGGRTVSHLVQASDLHATMLELAGIDVEAQRDEQVPEAPYDSVSFAPHLFAELETHPRTRVLAQTFAIGTEDPLLMRHAWSDGSLKVSCRPNASQYFDLTLDPWETDNLLDRDEPDEDVLAQLASFRAELEALMGVEGLCPEEALSEPSLTAAPPAPAPEAAAKP